MNNMETNQYLFDEASAVWSYNLLVFSLLFQYFMIKMKVPLVYVSVLKGKCVIFF